MERIESEPGAVTAHRPGPCGKAWAIFGVGCAAACHVLGRRYPERWIPTLQDPMAVIGEVLEDRLPGRLLRAPGPG